MSKKALVYFQDICAGTLSETDEGYEFVYTADYVRSHTARPVSLTLQVSEKTYVSKVLFSFFDGLIPEGWLLDLATSHWKVKRDDRFELLLLTCRDAIGAVTVIPEIN